MRNELKLIVPAIAILIQACSSAPQKSAEGAGSGNDRQMQLLHLQELCDQGYPIACNLLGERIYRIMCLRC